MRNNNNVLVILSAAVLLGVLSTRSCQAFTVWKRTTTTHRHPSSALFHARRRRIPNANELRQLQQEQAEEKQQTQEQQIMLEEDTVGNSVDQTTKMESDPNGKMQQKDRGDTTSTNAITDSMMPKAMTSEEEDEEAAEETSSSTTDLAAAALLASAVAGAGLVATEVGVTAELLMGGLVAISAGLGVLQQQQQQQQQTKEEEQSATSSLPTAEVDGKEVPTTNDEVNVDDAEEYQNLLQTYKNVFNRTDENVDDWLVAQQQQQQQELIDDTDNDMSTADILVQEEVTDREERVKAFASTTDESASSKKDVIQEDAIEAALVALAVAGAGAMVAEVGVATELAVGAAVALSAAFGAQQQSTKTSIDTETADKTERVENDVVAAVLEEQSDVEIKGMDARADPSTNQSSPQIADTSESIENKSDSQKQVEISSDNQSKEEGPRKGQSSLIVDSQINEAADVTINDVAQTFSELNLPIAEEDEPPTKNRLDEQSEKVINGIEKGSIEVSIDESPNEIESQDIATPTKESGLQSPEISAPEAEALPNGVDLGNLDFVSSSSVDKASTVVPSAQNGVPIENDVGNANIEEDLQIVFEPPPEQIEESEIPLTQEEVPSQTIDQNESFGQEDSPLPESVEQKNEQYDLPNSMIEAQEQSMEELTKANQSASNEIDPVNDEETSKYTNGVAESDLVSNEEGSLERETTTMGYEAPDSFAIDKNEAMAVADEYGEDRSIYREESELTADDESEEEAAIHCEEDKLTDDDEPEEESAINQKEEEILETLTPNMVLPPTGEKGIKPDDVVGDDPASQGKNEENSVRTLQPDMVLPPLSSFMDSSVKRIREQTRPLAETIVKSLCWVLSEAT